MSMSVSAKPAVSRAAKSIADIFESGRPSLYVRSFEEQRVGRILREIAAAMPGTAPPVWTWTLTEGLRHDDESACYSPAAEAPRQTLDFIASHRGPAIFHLKDFHEPACVNRREIRRRFARYLRSLPRPGQIRGDQAPPFTTSFPRSWIVPIVFLELRPPDVAELLEFVREEMERIAPAGRATAM